MHNVFFLCKKFNIAVKMYTTLNTKNSAWPYTKGTISHLHAQKMKMLNSNGI